MFNRFFGERQRARQNAGLHSFLDSRSALRFPMPDLFQK
jgi:hypothetical protein